MIADCFSCKLSHPARSKRVHPKVHGPAGYGWGLSLRGYNRCMRVGWRSALGILLLAAVAFAADEQQPPLALMSCPEKATDPACNPSKADLKKSKIAFSKALQLQKAEHFDEAYVEFDTAARLVPKNMEYVTALAL